MRYSPCKHTATLCGVLLAVLTAGCSRNAYDRYIPKEDAARSALETALAAWQQGQAPEKATTGASIELMDSTRRDGQKLAGYEIVEELKGEGPRRFSVRLNLGQPDQSREVCYVVLGRDPILVVRAEDYAQMESM